MKFQKSAARLILDKDHSTPSSELFQQLGWMRFDERVNYKKSILMYKSLHNLAPCYMSNKLIYSHDIHNLDLKTTINQTLHISKLKLEIYRNSLFYSGPKIWISLPESVRNAPTLGSFQQRYLRWQNGNGN